MNTIMYPNLQGMRHHNSCSKNWSAFLGRNWYRNGTDLNRTIEDAVWYQEVRDGRGGVVSAIDDLSPIHPDTQRGESMIDGA